ncbi:MAG: hypothetical protein ACXAC7_23475 [Candidatus Hodarchaeales archaeon]|jgi:hypothetical protein
MPWKAKIAFIKAGLLVIIAFVNSMKVFGLTYGEKVTIGLLAIAGPLLILGFILWFLENELPPRWGY